MKHLSRWKTVTAAATTAAVAAGAFGIGAAISDGADAPAAIEIAAERQVGDAQAPVTNDRERPRTDASTTNQVSVADQTASLPSAASNGSPDDVSDTGTRTSDQQVTAVPELQVVEPASDSPDSTDSSPSVESSPSQESVSSPSPLPDSMSDDSPSDPSEDDLVISDGTSESEDSVSSPS